MGNAGRSEKTTQYIRHQHEDLCLAQATRHVTRAHECTYTGHTLVITMSHQPAYCGPAAAYTTGRRLLTPRARPWVRAGVVVI